MYADLKGKTALVTGSGKKTGIGYAIAETLASCGVHIVIADLGKPASKDEPLKTATPEEMTEIAHELEERFSVTTLAVPVDVTSNPSIGRMMERVREKFDHVDILCNNAGASFGVPNTVIGYDEERGLRRLT